MHTQQHSHQALPPLLQLEPPRSLAQPEEVIQECLTLLRNPNIVQIARFTSPEAAELAAKPPPPLLVGSNLVREQCMLAPLAHTFDVGARRVLPRHLLRRSMVLGSLRLGSDDFQQRIALTACTGEEAVFLWRLQWHHGGVASLKEAPHAESAGFSTGNEAGRWVIQQVTREPEASDAASLPTTPHPKCSPEAVVRAQLAALKRGDFFEAACFNRKGVSSATSRPSQRAPSLIDQVAELQGLVGAAPYTMLIKHSDAVLGPAALLSQRKMVQEVSVRGEGSRAGWSRFVWELGLQGNLCWMTTAIRAVDAM